MSLLPALIAELRSTITTAVNLPSPPSGAINFFTTIQGSKKSFVEQLKAVRISLPCVVLDIGDFSLPDDNDWAMNTVGYACAPVTIIYISQWGGAGNNQSGTYSAAYAIKSSIDNVSALFTTFARVEEGKILSNVDAPVNSSLLADSEVQIVASAVAYTPGLRVQEY